MPSENNATRKKRELLASIAQLAFEGSLAQKVDRLPIDRFPKNGQPSRCCIYKSRAIARYRIMAMLGFAIEEETDELKPLSAYAAETHLAADGAGPVLTIIDEACKGCIKANYFVTNACRGCFARPCVVNCPKNAIEIINGSARIDPDKCVNCGFCQKVCPYHAIIYMPVPCEESCPVGAIAKNADGKESIDFNKCIFCGKCMTACPFGAIMERSQMVSVINLLREGRDVSALIAPAVMGQFQEPLDKIAGAIVRLGVSRVFEVAVGAETTAKEEAKEFQELIAQGKQPLLTTSCCPAYVEAVEKHAKGLGAFKSHTKPPLFYANRIVKEQHNSTATVFISPCPAKRFEAKKIGSVDFVISIEELGAMFLAKGIEISECEPYPFEEPSSALGRRFAISGGVTASVKELLGDGAQLKPMLVEGLDKKKIAMLNAFAKSAPCNFLEVMSCDGGCIGGPNVIAPLNIAKAKLTKELG